MPEPSQTNSKVMTRVFVKQIDELATTFYEDGWDGWVETLDADEKMSIIAPATSHLHAIILAQDWVAVYAECEAIRAENSALYDTGDESSDHRYQTYVTNDSANKYLNKFLAYMRSNINPY